MKKDDAVNLRPILECIDRIEQYNAAGKDAFLQSHLPQDATLRNLQTTSEATQRLPDAVKAAQPGLPWQQIAGFRNVLVHNYLGIDINQVWNVVERDLPALKQAVTALLSSIVPDAN